jgi:hypothetical protein
MQDSLNKNLSEDGINSQVLEQLLSAASKKLGCTPEQLRSQLESGQLEQAIKNSNPTNPQMAKLKQAVSDPKAAEKILKDPAAAKMLKKLGK